MSVPLGMRSDSLKCAIRPLGMRSDSCKYGIRDEG